MLPSSVGPCLVFLSVTLLDLPELTPLSPWLQLPQVLPCPVTSAGVCVAGGPQRGSPGGPQAPTSSGRRKLWN